MTTAAPRWPPFVSALYWFQAQGIQEQIQQYWVQKHWVQQYWVQQHWVQQYWVQKHWVQQYWVQQYWVQKHLVQQHWVQQHWVQKRCGSGPPRSVTDLDNCSRRVFLFGEAYSDHWKEMEGSLIAIVNGKARARRASERAAGLCFYACPCLILLFDSSVRYFCSILLFDSSARPCGPICLTLRGAACLPRR